MRPDWPKRTAGYRPPEENTVTIEIALKVIARDRANKQARRAYRRDLTDAEVAIEQAMDEVLDRVFPEAAQAVTDAMTALRRLSNGVTV